MSGVKKWAVVAALWSGLSIAAVAAAPPAGQHNDGGCETFTWNLTRELAAMKEPATLLAASADPEVNPVRLKEGGHVTATLLPQGSIKFVKPPARQRKVDHATAGLLFFKNNHAGRYRISLTSDHWIDLLDDGKTIESLSHEGRNGCELLHKSVEFELPANRDLVIQLSGDDAATVGIVVTAVAKE
jgi:hypothetical protein